MSQCNVTVTVTVVECKAEEDVILFIFIAYVISTCSDLNQLLRNVCFMWATERALG